VANEHPELTQVAHLLEFELVRANGDERLDAKVVPQDSRGLSEAYGIYVALSATSMLGLQRTGAYLGRKP